MHGRTIAVSACLLLLAACGGGSAEELPLAAAVATAAPAGPQDEASVPDPLALSYWSAGRVAALEAAKSRFVPAPDVAEGAGALAEAGPAPVAGPDPAPVAPAAPFIPAPPITLPAEPTLEPAPVPAIPPSPAALPLPSMSPLPDPILEPAPPKPIEATPLAVVVDRIAAVVIDTCTVDRDTGQRRLSYLVELNAPPQGMVRMSGNQIEHSATSRTMLVEETAADELISFLLVEDDTAREGDFLVPVVAELRVTDQAGTERMLVLPSALIPAAACAVTSGEN